MLWMFRWGAGRERVPGSVVEALRCVESLKRGRTPAREPERVRPVTEADVRATLDYLSPHVRAMVELQWLTGMRPGEVVQLCMRDLDHSTEPWVFRPAQHKNKHRGREREVFLDRESRRVLQPFLKLDQDAPLFSPRASERERRRAERERRKAAGLRPARPGAPSGLRHLGDRYTVENYRQAIQRAAERAGVPRWSPNQLRHAALSRLRANAGIEAGRLAAGHATIAMTEHYAEQDRGAAMRLLEGLS